MLAAGPWRSIQIPSQMRNPLNVSAPNAGEHLNWMQIEGNTGIPRPGDLVRRKAFGELISHSRSAATAS